jgi:hypothetical protein
MLRILGSHRRFCDRISRRDVLQACGLSALGTVAADCRSLVASPSGEAASIPGFGRVKSVILLFLYGGASQLETFDPKPEAPVEVRGKLGSIESSLPGCRVCEGLPNLAGVMDRTTVVRSMTHPFPIHGTAFSVTSTPILDTPMQDNPRDARHWPFIGSIVDYLDERRGEPATDVPRNVGMPFLHSSKRRHPIHNAGPYAAFLGPAYDPIWTDFEGEALHSQKYHFASTITTAIDPYGGVNPNCQFQWSKKEPVPPELTLDRLSLRRSLLEQFDLARRDLDAQSRIHEFSRTQQRAFEYLTNPRLHEALDLRNEPMSLREQYGMTLFGQSSLVARRLIEAGSRFVTVFWDEYGSVNSAWDTHYWHYPRLTEQLLPGLDSAYSALILDLEQRGLLDETLVLCITEHGRTPKLDLHGDHPSGTNQGGRNHWSRAYTSVLAGAGICRGKVVGRTDRIAGDVEETPVSPQDILATTYHLLGIDPHSLIHDRTGRPYAVGGNGRILQEVLA